MLVLNATGPQPTAPLAQVGWSDHLAQLDFFVKSPVLVGRAVLPAMLAEHYGRIVHVDSEVADLPPPGSSHYATAKSAQKGLARAWARELAPLGITVNSVGPGFIPVERHADLPPQVLEDYLATVPGRHFGTPDDIAHASAANASRAGTGRQALGHGRPVRLATRRGTRNQAVRGTPRASPGCQNRCRARCFLRRLR